VVGCDYSRGARLQRALLNVRVQGHIGKRVPREALQCAFVTPSLAFRPTIGIMPRIEVRCAIEAIEYGIDMS